MDFHGTWYLRIFWTSLNKIQVSIKSEKNIWHFTQKLKYSYDNHHHHKHQGLDPLIRSVSRVTTALANISSVFQLFSFLLVCSDMISKGFGLVAFFVSVKASSIRIHLSCLVCIQSVVHGVWGRLFCGHEGHSLPEVSIASFLPLQFFVSVRLLESNYDNISPNSSKNEKWSTIKL
jgi:hypothetical protein